MAYVRDSQDYICVDSYRLELLKENQHLKRPYKVISDITFYEDFLRKDRGKAKLEGYFDGPVRVSMTECTMKAAGVYMGPMHYLKTEAVDNVIECSHTDMLADSACIADYLNKQGDNQIVFYFLASGRKADHAGLFEVCSIIDVYKNHLRINVPPAIEVMLQAAARGAAVERETIKKEEKDKKAAKRKRETGPICQGRGERFSKAKEVNISKVQDEYITDSSSDDSVYYSDEPEPSDDDPCDDGSY